MKKIKIFLIISLTFVMIEMLLGFSLVYYGAVYKEVDGTKAGEMLEFIQKHNPQYYHTLIQEPSSMRDFQSFYTKKGDPFIVTGGIIFVFFAIGNVILFFTINSLAKQLAPEKEEEEIKENKEKEPEA